MKLSVLVVTYNHEKFIAQALDSILMQKPNFDYEIVIGEDCSNDGTRDIVAEYKKKYPDRIRLLLNESNIGAGKNFKQTYEACSGEYIALLEGDDYWTSPDKLQKQVDFMDENLDFAICSHNVVVKREDGGAPDSEWLGRANREVMTLKDLLRFGSGGATGSLLFRNRVFGEFPDWYFTLPGGDWTLQILCASHGMMRYFREPMGVYRTAHSSNGLSAAIRQQEEKCESSTGVAYKNTLEIIDAIDEHFQYIHTALLQNQRIYCFYNLALEYDNSGGTSISRTYAWKVLKEVGGGYSFITFKLFFRLLINILPYPFNRLKKYLLYCLRG